MTGRGLGSCAGSWRSRQFGGGRGMGCGRGLGGERGMGLGGGRAVGPGRGLGWFNAGIDSGFDEPGASIKGALEQKAAFLKAELTRIEAMLSDSNAGGIAPQDIEEGKSK